MSERILYPVIDLLGGRVVRALRGASDQPPVADEDPIAIALRWREAGARWLSLVDLDGAREGAPRQLEAIRAIIAEVGLPAQVAGGMRDMASVEAALEAGASRVVINAATPDEQALVAECVARWGDAMAVALEARDGRVTVAGWLPSDAATALDVARAMRYLGVATLIVTSSSSAGQDPLPGELRRALPGVQLIAGGASASLESLRACLTQGFDGALLGQALYDGRYTFAGAQALADATPAYEAPPPDAEDTEPGDQADAAAPTPSDGAPFPSESAVMAGESAPDGASERESPASGEDQPLQAAAHLDASEAPVKPEAGDLTHKLEKAPIEPAPAPGASLLPDEPAQTDDPASE